MSALHNYDQEGPRRIWRINRINYQDNHGRTPGHELTIKDNELPDKGRSCRRQGHGSLFAAMLMMKLKEKCVTHTDYEKIKA